METNIGESQENTEYSFKSYYVVWKLLMRWKKHAAAQKFKSYYVVWKPQANDGRFHQHIQFKSYYVVWKLFFGRNPTPMMMSLNRTM